MKGGFFLMKKPLEFMLSVYSNSENAITGILPIVPRRHMAAYAGATPQPP